MELQKNTSQNKDLQESDQQNMDLQEANPQGMESQEAVSSDLCLQGAFVQDLGLQEAVPEVKEVQSLSIFVETLENFNSNFNSSILKLNDVIEIRLSSENILIFSKRANIENFSYW